ncbi:hemoglobin [Catalinimonas alkaloidigena]|uniref:Hemoglobin n=2 Tax=Catalinimonas alkaloidigena TaxID=1075417 RepID=A0A1G9MWI4_9BACT|nr:hemoglobin [Catalinimonas alkaloidigena]
MISRYFQYVDWKSNLPQMYSYWSSLLLGRKEESRSEGRPFPKHMMMLGLTETQFQRWIQLFYKAIDEKYKGEKAAKMKLNIHALTLALQSRLHVMNADD